MACALHRATLALATPLGTPLSGDTLFGQCCWALREAEGEVELTRRLEGYTQGQPWLVVSDGFPAGYLPKPTLPQNFEPKTDPAARRMRRKSAGYPSLRPVARCQYSLRARSTTRSHTGARRFAPCSRTTP